MFNFFPKRKSVGSAIITMAEMDQDLRPSLFVRGSLLFKGGLNESNAVKLLGWGRLDETGFATNWSGPLSECSQRKPEFVGNFYSDRFLTVTSGRIQEVLAHIEVKEAPVYDEHYRCPIDFTGFEVILTLHEQAFGIFVEHLGLPVPDSKNRLVSDGDYFQDFAIRIPSATFPFPEPRGGPSPYSPAGKYVTESNLKVIRKFDVNDLIVAKFADQWMNTKPAPNVPFRERYGIQSGLHLSYSTR
jgi:hypothetical protein